MKVVIDRLKWLRGALPDTKESVMLNKAGERCCLGFVGEACGVEDSAMLDKPSPSLCQTKVKNLGWDWLLVRGELQTEIAYFNSSQCRMAMKINDAILDERTFGEWGIVSTEEDRERKISALMGKEGIELEFIN